MSIRWCNKYERIFYKSRTAWTSISGVLAAQSGELFRRHAGALRFPGSAGWGRCRQRLSARFDLLLVRWLELQRVRRGRFPWNLERRWLYGKLTSDCKWPKKSNRTVSDLLCVAPKSSPLNFLARDPGRRKEIGGDVWERVIANRMWHWCIM